MKEIILDTLLDSLKIIPFLFIAFLIIELIEHTLTNKNKEIITKSKKIGPIRKNQITFRKKQQKQTRP